MSEKTVEILELTTGYKTSRGEKPVTRNTSSSLFSGEVTCLLGPNGAGKSTLLRTLSGFLKPLSGKILIRGIELEQYSETELAKVIGVVLTDKVGTQNMTVRELVETGRSPYTGFWGRLSKEDNDIVSQALALVKIEEMKNRMVHTLSDGERQKVMIAKALAQQTPLIFLDEPTAFLDYPSKVEIMQLLRHLARLKQKTIFLSTHDLELALHIADRIWLLDKKIGLATGTPESLSISGKIAEYFDREGLTFDPISRQFQIENQ